MEKDLRDVLLSTLEESLDAQLRAIKRLRSGSSPSSKPSRPKRMSQVDMAYDILSKAQSPLHISEIIHRIQIHFGIQVDRESLVSSLTKKVARGNRFTRPAANTFGVHAEVSS